jgi:hypothetical protein
MNASGMTRRPEMPSRLNRHISHISIALI